MHDQLEKSGSDGLFDAWCATISDLESNEKRFDEWLFLNGSTVLLGEKAGELLSVDPGEFLLARHEMEACLERLGALWDFRFKILRESNGLTKFIIFNEARVQSTLDEVPFCVMGAQLRYAFPLSVDSFLEEVVHRWAGSGALPHEIGVALGYPLDDVFGYMGLLPLQCKGVCGWQVYGCMETSKGLSCAYNEARCRALILLSKRASCFA